MKMMGQSPIKILKWMLLLLGLTVCAFIFAENDFTVKMLQFIEVQSQPPYQQEPKQQQPKQDPTRVLLITYYRGGSSFLGELFAQNKDFYYWFEPLAAYSNSKKSHPSANNVYLKLENKTLRALPKEIIMDKIDVLHNALSCDKVNVYMKIWNHHFRIHDKEPHSNPMNSCKRDKKRSGGRRQDCMPLQRQYCANASVIAAKSIRIAPYFLQELLKRIPDLKVIYYTRDPRGLISSRMRDIDGNLSTAVEDLCLQMMADYADCKTLSSLYPEQLIWIKYEDLASTPFEVSQKIYAFVQRAMPSYLNMWIKDHTQKGGGGRYTTRRNSTKAASRWQESLDTNVREEIEQICRTPLKALGYA